MRGLAIVEMRVLQRVQDKSLYWEVKVRSAIRPRIKKIGIVEVEHGVNQSIKVGVLAAAMAEELCEQYHDMLDPAVIERAARGLYERTIADNPQVAGLGDELPRGSYVDNPRLSRK